MANIDLAQLLEAGVHFGHKANRWNPKMFPYIYAERDGIHITGSTKNPETYKRAGHTVVNLIKRGNEFLDDKRAELAKSKTIVSWEEVAQKWIHAFESL
jgi:ribosomal protein S2